MSEKFVCGSGAAGQVTENCVGDAAARINSQSKFMAHSHHDHSHEHVRRLSSLNRAFIAGILLNDCSAMLTQSLAPMLEQETGVPVLGYLPHMPEAVFGSRHLGLYTAAEIDGLAARIGALAAQLEQSVDMPRLLALCGRRTADGTGRERKAPARKQAARIAVARDEAFCFSYAETLESLRDAGAELVFFSPVHDAALPGGAGGLYLPGGYPELYAEALSENHSMRNQVRKACEGVMKGREEARLY